MRRRADRRPQINRRQRRYVELRWRAACTGAGFVLTREARLWGAIYMLVPLAGRAQIFYSLDEVAQYLDRQPAAAP